MISHPKNYPSHFPKSKKEESEFGPGKKDILICRHCNAVYWYKSWHHKLEDYPELKEGKDVRFSICPACAMIKDKRFEGEIILENVPKKIKEEIKKLAKNFGKRAFERDPMDRIISIEDTTEENVRILTTENQLAQRLSEKIKETFSPSSKLSISHSNKDRILRTKIVFEKKA